MANYRIRINDNTGQVIQTMLRAMLFLLAGFLFFVPFESVPVWLRLASAAAILGLALFQQHLLDRFSLALRWIPIAALVLLALGSFSFWLPILFAFFGALALRQLKPPEVWIDAAGVTLVRSIGSKHLAWGEINNLVLRDGLLTIDLVNNTLFQLPLQEPAGEWPPEAAFNAFCATQLEAGSAAR